MRVQANRTPDTRVDGAETFGAGTGPALELPTCKWDTGAAAVATEPCTCTNCLPPPLFLDPGRFPKFEVAQKEKRGLRIKLCRSGGLTGAAEIKADPPDGDADSNCLSSIIHQTAVL